MIQNLQAVPRLARRRHVDEGEKNSRDQLQPKSRHRRAAENISPARRFARNRMVHGLAHWRAELEPLIDPLADAANQAHGRCPLICTRDLFAAERPGVGNSPALMCTVPSTILNAYSNNPRS